MNFVGVELLSRCRACDAPVPVNAVLPAAECPKCRHEIPLGADLFAALFTMASVEVATQPLGFEVSSTLPCGDQSVRAVLRRADVACARCRSVMTIPDGAASAACPCGTAVSVRAVPPGIAASRVACIVGEDPASMSAAAGPRAEMMHCPGCGAPVAPDRDRKELRCTYCGNVSVLRGLESELARPLRRFYLGCRASTSASLAPTWGTVFHAAIDDGGGVYVLAGESGGSGDVLALDATLQHVRWKKSGIRDVTAARLAVRGDVLAIVRRGDHAHLVRTSDGETMGTFPTGPVPFEESRLRSAAPHPDGTWLASIVGQGWGISSRSHSTLLRFDPAGKLVPTWTDEIPPPPDLGTAIPSLAKVSSPCPAYAEGEIDLVAGHDGSVLLTNGEHLLRVDRTGEVSCSLPRPRDGSWDPRALSVDDCGRIRALTRSAFLVFEGGGMLRTRVDRGGGAGETALACARDGTSLLVGPNGRARILGPDGAPVYVSEASARDHR